MIETNLVEYQWALERVGDSGKRWLLDDRQHLLRVEKLIVVRDGHTDVVILFDPQPTPIGRAEVFELAEPADQVAAKGLRFS